MNKLLLISLLLALLSLSSKCNSTRTSKNELPIAKNSIVLNDEGIKHIQKYSFTKDTAELDTALHLLKQAIVCDSNNVSAYKNLADIYGYLHRYHAEIAIYGKIIQLKHGDPLFIMAKANLYREIKALDSAKIMYSEANSAIEERLKIYPESVNLLFDKIMLEYNLKGKNEATRIFKDEIKKHPKDSTALIQRLNYLLE